MRREEMFTLIDQAMISADVALQVIEHLKEGFSERFGMDQQFVNDIRSIEITGCGDSWMTSNAVRTAYETITGLKTNARRTIDFSRYSNPDDFDNPLVIGVTISGGVARTRECILKAQKYGFKTLAVTNNINSPTGNIVDKVAHIGLPAGLTSGYGLHSYSCSVVTLIHVAVAIGILRENITAEQGDEIIDEMIRLIKAYGERKEEYDTKQKLLADLWTDKKAVEFIADNEDFSSAYFSCANVFEEYGLPSAGTDTLNWKCTSACFSDPSRIARVFFLNCRSVLAEVQKDNILRAIENGSPVCVITDDQDYENGRATIIRTPYSKYDWLNPLFQHLGFDAAVGYIRRNKGLISFCSEEELFQGETVKNRLKNTEILVD